MPGGFTGVLQTHCHEKTHWISEFCKLHVGPLSGNAEQQKIPLYNFDILICNKKKKISYQIHDIHDGGQILRKKKLSHVICQFTTVCYGVQCACIYYFYADD